MNQKGVLVLEHLELPSAGSSAAYCRLCLARDNLVEMSPNPDTGVTSDDETSSATQAVRLTELIFECTDVRLSPENEAPCAVCEPCLRSLMEFYRFRARAKRVDELIKSRQLVKPATSENETDKTDLEQEQQLPANNQLEEPKSQTTLDQSKRNPIQEEDVRPESTPNSLHPKKVSNVVTVEPRKRPSGDFLAVGVKRPRPKLMPTPVIIASTTGGVGTGGGGGKYRCRYCPKSFKSAAGLTEHSRNHNRPHQCPNCLEQFQHAPSLARHVRNRTCFTFTKYRCRVCTESFLEQADWAEHIKIHASDFPYQCQECLSQFKHKATLRRHVNTVHLLQY